ncbi:hypothetical protein SAMN04487887_101198 [Enterococcus casseliflavus]|nr:hypothetical protein SAMN04487887_101198 [Enterococcus casseliflavus]
MKMLIEEIEYRYFLQYGKYLDYFYQQYMQANVEDPDVEKGIAEIQRLVEEERYHYIRERIRITRKAKKSIPLADYPDFNKLIHWGFTLSKLSFLDPDTSINQLEEKDSP